VNSESLLEVNPRTTRLVIFPVAHYLHRDRALSVEFEGDAGRDLRRVDWLCAISYSPRCFGSQSAPPTGGERGSYTLPDNGREDDRPSWPVRAKGDIFRLKMQFIFFCCDWIKNVRKSGALAI
jgi:hypothetical protein